MTSHSFRRTVLIALTIVLAAFAAFAQEQKVLTNKDVTDMVKQGLAESVIVKVIQASDTNFDLTADAVTQLQSAGVTPTELDAMQKAAADKKRATAPPAAAPAPAAPSAAADANAAKFLLKEGTEIPLKFASDLTSKTATEGDTVEMTLTENLKVGDAVVAREGARAVAVVSNAKKAGMMGKPGELNIQLQHLTVGDNRVRVRGTKGREGDSKTGTAVALTVLFGPIGLIKHGKNVEVKAGTPLTAFVDQDIWLPAAN